MASKQDKDLMDAAAPRPATPQEEQAAADYQRALQAQGVTPSGVVIQGQVEQRPENAEPGPRIDETTPGGQYEVDGRLVDAEGHAL